MDPLSGIAGGIALYQLLESVKRLVDLGRSIHDAPANVTALFSSLELLAAAIKKARDVSSAVKLDATAERVLQDCERKVNRFLHKIEQATINVNSSSVRLRTWYSLKIALKKSEIESLQQEIESAKSTLTLVQGAISIDSIASIDNKQTELLAVCYSLQQYLYANRAEDLQPIGRRMRDPYYTSALVHPDIDHFEASWQTSPDLPETIVLQHEPKKPQVASSAVLPRQHTSLIQSRQCQTHWTRKIPMPSFVVEVTSRTYDVTTARNEKTRKSLEEERNYIVTPNYVGRMLGMSRGVSVTARSIAGWKYSIQTFRTVPSDALIFEFCREGNLAAVRSLFKRGDASPWDRDPDGRTPLWFAAESLQIDLAQLLLDEGADPHASDFRNRRGPIIASVTSKDINIHPKLAMINMLQSYTQEDYDDDTYLHVMGVSMLAYRPQKDIKMSWPDRRSAMTQLFSTLLPQFHPTHPGLAKLLHDSVKFYYERDVLQRLLHAMKGSIDIVNPAQSVVYEAIKTRLLQRDMKSMRMMMQRSERLHTIVKNGERLTQDGCLVPVLETPTMLAMYDMKTFMLWRTTLKQLNFNTENFIRQEMSNGLLSRHGWNEKSMGLLFDGDVAQGLEDHSGPSKSSFPTCERCGNEGTQLGAALKIDLIWRRQLRQIRLGRLASDQYQNPRTVGEGEHIDISMAFGDDQSYGASKATEVPGLGSSDLPYRIVCSKPCTDGVCVAWAFEDDGKAGQNPVFPAFPIVIEEEEVCPDEEIREVGEVCPTRGMPGAFVE